MGMECGIQDNTGFWWEKLKERDNWKTNTWVGGQYCTVDWIHLVKNRAQWRALQNTIINLLVS
jgi:hypothetical protein